jgi:protein SCO1/2
VLKAYGEAAGADPEHWTFLTGERQAIWSLSADGFKLAAGESAEGDGPLFHSTKFVLVDREGRIRGYYDGISEEGIDALVQELNTYSDDLWPAHR